MGSPRHLTGPLGCPRWADGVLVLNYRPGKWAHGQEPAGLQGAVDRSDVSDARAWPGDDWSRRDNVGRAVRRLAAAPRLAHLENAMRKKTTRSLAERRGDANAWESNVVFADDCVAARRQSETRECSPEA